MVFFFFIYNIYIYIYEYIQNYLKKCSFAVVLKLYSIISEWKKYIFEHFTPSLIFIANVIIN